MQEHILRNLLSTIYHLISDAISCIKTGNEQRALEHLEYARELIKEKIEE